MYWGEGGGGGDFSQQDMNHRGSPNYKIRLKIQGNIDTVLVAVQERERYSFCGCVASGCHLPLCSDYQEK